MIQPIGVVMIATPRDIKAEPTVVIAGMSEAISVTARPAIAEAAGAIAEMNATVRTAPTAAKDAAI